MSVIGRAICIVGGATFIGLALYYFFPKVNKEFRDFLDNNRDEMLDKFITEVQKYGMKFTIENTRV